MTAIPTMVAGVNLLSPQRRERALRGLLLRRWGAGLACGCAALAVASGGVMVWGQAGAGGASELESVSAALAQRESELRSERALRDGLRKKDDAARSVGEHADWSVLLRLLAGLRQDRVVFRTIDLQHKSEEIAPRGERGAGRANTAKVPPRVATWHELTLTGVGRDVASVNEFVVALEESGLFDRVRRAEGNAAEETGASFRVVCVVRDGSREVR